MGIPYAWDLESVESSQENEEPTYQEIAHEREDLQLKIVVIEEQLKEKEEVIFLSRRRQGELEARVQQNEEEIEGLKKNLAQYAGINVSAYRETMQENAMMKSW